MRGGEVDWGCDWALGGGCKFCCFPFTSLFGVRSLFFSWERRRKSNRRHHQRDSYIPSLQTISLTQKTKTVNPTLSLHPKPALPHRNALPRRWPLQHDHPSPRRPRNIQPALPPHLKLLKPPCIPLPLHEQLPLHFLLPHNSATNLRISPESDGDEGRRLGG